MDNKISRREVIKGAAVGVSGMALTPIAPLISPGTSVRIVEPVQASAAVSPADVVPLTSTSEVYVPPKHGGFLKFSFDFPEPSVEFEKLLFSFRIFTFENVYAPDRSRMTVTRDSDSLHIRCDGFVWAGGQQTAEGRLEAHVRRNGAFVEWNATASMNIPIKSIATILRRVPRGKISAGGGSFFDPKDDEQLFGYPFGGGSLFTAGGMDSPIVVIQSGEHEYYFLSSLLDKVRASRFYFQPGDNGYRVELIHEREGWARQNSIESPTWRVGRTATAEEAFRPHFEHVEKSFSLPNWETRADVPAWFRDVKLVLSIHGMHWTGYIFNDFAKALKTLEWTATQISPSNVLVFLPAWDGRYYWNYPIYKPDPRLGGEDGFRALIEKGHSLGFHFMPMFGTNAANRLLPEFANVADAATSQIDGDAFNLNWVDWDNDRHNEGWGPYMNLGVESWRNWLFERIASTIETYKADAYFLDIAGGWENNTKADMHEGTRQLAAELAKRCPGILGCGEMSYDALLGVLPLYHVFGAQAYPAGFQKYCRAFEHLSLPAPGRGSSGVHESGFGHFDPKSLNLGPHQIPTITVVDDTFEKHRDTMAQIIAVAKQRPKG
ncbi:MAG TPA: hypothetical protein VHP80_09280 [Candidatus Acidoferrum sp.]|nr:hypothetical protein [Candidatus Acidoferrum sp.]